MSNNGSQNLLGHRKEGMAFVISAPAGTGKTTLVKMLTEEFLDIVESVSFTTRAPREGEVDGKHYRFVSTDTFERLIQEGEFLEYVRLYGSYYGTSLKWVREKQKEGKSVVLVIDTQGGLQLKNKLKASYIFLQPPSLDALRQRLIKRQTESLASIEQRLQWALKELKEGRRYDYLIVNDDLSTAYQVLRSIVIAEGHRMVADTETN